MTRRSARDRRETLTFLHVAHPMEELRMNTILRSLTRGVTAYAFLETRPFVSWKTPIHDELRAKLEELAANPRQVSFRVMEGVMAACVLAQNDALTTGKLHIPYTRQALELHVGRCNAQDGGFDWEKSNQPPSEIDDHFGATMASHRCRRGPGWLRGNTDGPGRVEQNPSVPVHNTPPVNLHQRSMLLWAPCTSTA